MNCCHSAASLLFSASPGGSSEAPLAESPLFSRSKLKSSCGIWGLVFRIWSRRQNHSVTRKAKSHI